MEINTSVSSVLIGFLLKRHGNKVVFRLRPKLAFAAEQHLLEELSRQGLFTLEEETSVSGW